MRAFYCVFNETKIGGFFRSGGHIRQWKETKGNERYPILRDNRANITIKDGIYTAKATNGEVIAVSDIFINVISRIKYAQPSATINVEYNRRFIDVRALSRDYSVTYAPHTVQRQRKERHINSVRCL